MFIDDRNHPAVVTTIDFLDALNRVDPQGSNEDVANLAKVYNPFKERSSELWSEVVVSDTRRPSEGGEVTTQTAFDGATVTATLHGFTDLNVKSDDFEVNINQYDADDVYAVPTFATGIGSIAIGIEIIRGDAADYVDWAKRTGVMLKMFA